MQAQLRPPLFYYERARYDIFLADSRMGMQRQSMRTIEFRPDTEALKILEGLAPDARDKYINDAVKAFSSGTGKPNTATSAAPKSDNSPAGLVTAELERIFGGTCDTIRASAADSDDFVMMTETASQLRVKCGIKDAIDILKSLRQPITVQEVWDIMSVLG